MAFDLEEALRQYPLPEGQDDTTVNRGQAATALGVSETMISRYLEQGLPVVSRGSNGQAYAFRLSEIYAWRMAQDAERRARKAEGDRAAAQLAMLFRNDAGAEDDGPVLTAKQIQEEADADYRRQRAAELRGELVRTHQVRQLLEDLLVVIRTRLTTLPDFCEMEFGLEPAQVDKLQRHTDGAMVELRLEIETALVRRDGEVRPLGGPETGGETGADGGGETDAPERMPV